MKTSTSPDKNEATQTANSSQDAPTKCLTGKPHESPVPKQEFYNEKWEWVISLMNFA